MKKVLCYSMAFGQDARRAAEIMIESYRDFGFVGEIFLFADSEVKGATELVKMPDPLSWNGRNNLRAFVDEHTPASWDWYWYSDVDIVAVRHLDEMFAGLQPDLLNWCRAATTRFCDHPVNLDLTEAERSTERGCNAGVCFIPASLRPLVFPAWRQRIARIEKDYPDRLDANQTSLNSLIAKKEVPSAPFDDDWVLFPVNPLSQPVDPFLQHFAGYGSFANKIPLMEASRVAYLD